MATHWLDAQTAKVRHTTHDQYRGHIENHLSPFFGDVKTNEVNLEMVERFITQCNNLGIFVNTTRKIITTLGSIMKYAAHPKRNYAPYNPVPYAENLPKKVKKEAEMATLEETLAIVQQMKKARDRLIVLTAATTGMREGEIFGLKWEDIQWKDSQIFVRRTFNHRRFYEPKSEKSKRTIDVPQELLHELKKWKLACPKGELDLVFPNGKGYPINASNWLRQVWHPARRRAGIRHLTPHSLRHFSGSFLLEQGEGMGFVQDFLGHSSIQMTMDTYRHKMKKQNRKAAGKFGKVFFGHDGCKMGAIGSEN
ncbi:MAG: tyrosine-type recombinase/integrase [Proteobacteria bacterium]|nr:tyrosine-type recombinase/integrase [Pseudomonadota bacterium]